MTANTTSNATTEGMITFNGLKLDGAAAAGAIGGGVVVPCIGTVTGARRGVTAGVGGGSGLVLTTVTSSRSSFAAAGVEPLTIGCTGTGANCAVPEAIVKSSINSATF